MEFLEAKTKQKQNKTKQNKIKTNKRTEIKKAKNFINRRDKKKINLTLDYGGGIEHFEGKTKQNQKNKKQKNNKKTSSTCET